MRLVNRVLCVIVLAALLGASTLRAACADDMKVRRGRVCASSAGPESWARVIAALGIHASERLGDPDDCSSRAHKLMDSWKLLRLIELPGLGNAAEYVDRHIDSLVYDERVGAGVNA